MAVRKKKKRLPAVGRKAGRKKSAKRKKGAEKVGNKCPPKEHQWKSGQSGNPSGLSKGAIELRDAARGHTKEALNALVEALTCKSASSRVAAACAILDRGWGKPKQDMKLDVATHDDWVQRLAGEIRGEHSNGK